ncbi:unnamed protein product [Bursaphelenchus okinawaensis]|uniref:Uncharacterized protein n=1 Tax=Bursaphelenchus okinawaensis TaxID=465554 RepID=A0A811KWE8_9BILA|nr:unnamed protein product [Bursaphelenchus okinawaensis]CAG9113255.1 unnamed protein product [Bursaphelenchus okinawaensis]
MVDGGPVTAITKESVLKILLSAITLVFQDLEIRYPGYALEATLKYREVYVLGASTVYEYKAKITYKDRKVSYEWLDPTVLIQTHENVKADINGNGYVFSLLGMKEYISVGDYYYKTSLMSRNMIDMAKEKHLKKFEFVTDGFNLFYKINNTLLSWDPSTSKKRSVCKGVPGELIGFDESTFNIVVKDDHLYFILGIHESCFKKKVGPYTGLHKIPLYLSRTYSDQLESQWYNLRHVALFSPDSVDKISPGHLIKFKAIPLEDQFELCHDLSKYIRHLIKYLAIIQIVIHLCFVMVVVMLYVIIYGNVRVKKHLKKLVRDNTKRKRKTVDKSSRNRKRSRSRSRNMPKKLNR